MKKIILIIVVLLLLCLFVRSNWGTGGKIRYRLCDVIWNAWIKMKYMNGLKCLDRRACRDNLELFADIMESHEITFTLSEGTALGIRRDGDFIAHDDDVDTAISDKFYDTFVEHALADLSRHGFSLIKAWSNGRFLTFERNRETLDVDFVKSGRWCMFLNRGKIGFEGSCENVDKFMNNLRQIEFKGRQYNIPTDDYFEYLYGSDWKTPHKTNSRCV